jgi:hypothetical protein
LQTGCSTSNGCWELAFDDHRIDQPAEIINCDEVDEGSLAVSGSTFSSQMQALAGK